MFYLNSDGGEASESDEEADEDSCSVGGDLEQHAERVHCDWH